MKNDIVKLILNGLDDRELKVKQFAKMIGMDEDGLGDFLNRDRLEIPFPCIKKALEILCEDNLQEYMEYLYNITQKPDNMRMISEYASITRNFPLLEKMIESLSQSDNKKDKEWAVVYSIAIRFQMRDTDDEKLMGMIDDVKVKLPEMKILKKILRARVMYSMKEYSSMFRIANAANNELSKLKEGYLKRCYQTRINELFAQGYLYVLGETQKARYYANLVLNNEEFCATFKMYAYHIIGTSFLFENYEMAIANFENYKLLLEEHGRDDLVKEVIEKDIFFTKVLWNRDIEGISTTDEIELAHYEAKFGDKKNVPNLLKNSKCPFALCYNGIATNDPQMLLESFFKFLGKKQKYFANVPARYLEKYPSYHATVKLALENINVA
jgi:hypothetical protein